CLVTAAYWAFTLTDGALRMLVLLHFHGLGYSPIQIAFLFLFYEFFGIVTNLLGGWIGSRLGLNFTLWGGLGLQVLSLGMLALLGFVPALLTMAGALLAILAVTMMSLSWGIGKAKAKVKFTQIFSKSPEINVLSAARFFLFGARDVWFVVGLPITNHTSRA